ncbi:MAG: hypothetical protein Q9177_001777 [Variospora cf. flavescens]
MDAFLSLRLLCIIIITFTLLHLTTSQLLGSLTSSDGKFLIEVTISNPTQERIAILNWNNIFDPITRFPRSLIVRDDRGDHIPMATTYAMRAGMHLSDFHIIAPEVNFTRRYDLRSMVQGVPNGLHGNITVELPGGFKGVPPGADHWTVPVTAFVTSLTGLLPSFGNYEAAGLQDITLAAPRLHLQLGRTGFNDSTASAADTDPLEGIQVDPMDCNSNADRKQIDETLYDAGVYAKALILAADDEKSRLFANFFLSPARPTVKKIASLAHMGINGQGPSVTVYCTDDLSICAANPRVLGHSATESWLGPPQIVICPVALNLPRAMPPCAKRPGKEIGATASRVMLHLILTLNTVVTDTLTGNVYGSGACQLLKNSRILETAKNPDSYAQLAIAQWHYGLGGLPYQGPQCAPRYGIIPRIQ